MDSHLMIRIAQMHNKSKPSTVGRQAATSAMDGNSKPTYSTNAIALAITTGFYLYFTNLNLYKYIITDTVCSVNIANFVSHNRIDFFKLGLIFVGNQDKTKMNKIYEQDIFFLCELLLHD